LGIEASLKAIAQLQAGEDDRRAALVRQRQQLEFEAQRAFEQYNEVDARNRLVAAELERRWNEKLEEFQKVQALIAALDKEVHQLSAADCDKIVAMGESFERVWKSNHCPVELKKKIARTIIEEVIATSVDAHTLRFVIHWKGGVHTEITMQRPTSATAQKTPLEALEIIRKMAACYGDSQIACVLNRLGHRTGKDKRWNHTRVETARRNHSIAGQKQAKVDPEILTLTQAAKYCRVSNKTIERLAASGKLPMRQVTPRAPWEIRRSDLDSEPVRSILDHLRRTGKLVLEGGDSVDQMQLFPEKQGDDNARHHE
jgi:excisionase family DNA binding protein